MTEVSEDGVLQLHDFPGFVVIDIFTEEAQKEEMLMSNRVRAERTQHASQLIRAVMETTPQPRQAAF